MVIGERIRVLFLVFVGILTLAIFWTWVNRYILSPQAAQKNVGITMSPATGNIATGEAQDVTIIVASEDESNKISGIDLSLAGSGATITALSGCSSVGGSSEGYTDLISDVASSAARKSCVTLKPDADLKNAVQFNATISCTSAGSATLSINTDRSQVVGNTQEVLYGFGTVGTATFTCGGVGGGEKPKGPHVEASFEPSHCDSTVGGKCDYELKLVPSEDKDRISAYHLKLSFDPSIIKADEVSLESSSVLSALAQAVVVPTTGTANSPTPVATSGGKACTTDQQCIDRLIAAGTCTAGSSCPIRCDIIAGGTSGFCVGDLTKLTPSVSPSTSPIQTTIMPSVTPFPLDQICREEMKVIDNKAGTIEIAYTCAKKIGELPRSMIAKLSFTGLKDGSDLLKITEAEVVGTIAGAKFPFSGVDASYTIGAGGGGGGETGKVNIETVLRFQGVTKKPKSRDTIAVKVGLGDGGLKETLYKTVEFKVGDDGLWRGTVNFDVSEGSGYKLLVKGHEHMQKKICESSPTENFPGSYSCDKGSIALKEGTNTLDFSKIVLLVGDLEPQDGICNAHDQSLVRNLLGKSDAESIRLADVNYDGIVNAVDHSLMIAALSVRYDEK